MKQSGGEDGGSGDGSSRTALWFKKTKNQGVSTGPLACPFARSLAPLTHFAHSQARGKVYNLMFQFHLVLNHSAKVIEKISLSRFPLRFMIDDPPFTRKVICFVYIKLRYTGLRLCI